MVFQELLNSIPGLEECLLNGSDEEVGIVADLVRTLSQRARLSCLPKQISKGASGAQGDDTKSLKGVVLDWIVPQGQVLSPALSHNVKIDRGFNHERTGALLCPAGLDWSNQRYIHPFSKVLRAQTSSASRRSSRVGN